MGYASVTLEGFSGGLNLISQADIAREQNQALDLLNVTFGPLGSIKQRPGYRKFTASPGINRYDSLMPFYKTDGTKQLLAGAGSRLEALSTGGTVVGTMTGLTQGPWGFTRFGAPTAEVAYAGNGYDTLKKWDGANWSSPAASTQSVAGTNMPKGRFLAVTPNDNRLVVAGFSTTTGGPNNLPTSVSHVYFSEPGKPEEYLTNSYQQIRPGDGESIVGMVRWGSYLFVFKETMYSVFYGTSTAADGTPVFNFRDVDVGVGAISPRAIVAGEDGVYFLSRNGVYRTTGQSPELVSSSIEPFFKGDPAPYFSSQTLNPGALQQCSMAWHRNQLYLAVPTGSSTTNDRMFVFSPRYKWWTLYDIRASAMASMRVGSQEELLFAYASGLTDIGQHGLTYLDDAGVAINSWWNSSWLDFKSPDMKTVRQWKVWASGKLQTGLADDYEALSNVVQLDLVSGLDLWAAGDNPSDLWGDGSDETQRWGSGATSSGALIREAHRGTVFSLSLGSYGGSPWEVQRVTFHLRGTRTPSIVDAD